MSNRYSVQTIHLKRKSVVSTKMTDGAIHLLSYDVLSTQEKAFHVGKKLSKMTLPSLKNIPLRPLLTGLQVFSLQLV